MDSRFAVPLHWGVKRSKTQEFAAAWEDVTRGMMERGSLGSEASFYAVARVPDDATRTAAMEEFSEPIDDRADPHSGSSVQ